MKMLMLRRDADEKCVPADVWVPEIISADLLTHHAAIKPWKSACMGGRGPLEKPG